MPEPKPEPLQIDEFLALQSIETIRATIEPAKDAPTKVKVTPFAQGSRCLCHLAVTIEKDLIDHVVPTGEFHYCCGKRLSVVEIYLKVGATVPLQDVFDRMSLSASESSVGRHAPPTVPTGTVPGDPMFFGRQGPEPQAYVGPAPQGYGAEIACSPGYEPCVGRYGSGCFYPAGGQTCREGLICGPGFYQCIGRYGFGCYHPASGQNCYNGRICGPGFEACYHRNGTATCYHRASGQQCVP